MPNASRLVTQKVEAEGCKGVHQIGGRIEQQCDTLRVFGVNGEVKGLLRLDPGDAKRQRCALGLLPCLAFGKRRGRGMGIDYKRLSRKRHIS